MPLNQIGSLNTIGDFLGHRGDALPTTGTHGASILIESGKVNPVAEAGDLFYITVTQQPVSGSLNILNNGAFDFTGPDSSFTYEWFKNSVSQGTDTVTLRTNTSQSIPIANAGSDQSVDVNSPVIFDGSSSNDADSDPLTYAWTVLTAPVGSTATITSPTSVNPSFTPDVIGSYVIQLIVNDGKANSTPSTLTLTANSIQSVAAITIVGIPDGDYLTNFCHRATGVQISQHTLTFSGETASQSLSVSAGTSFMYYTVDALDPTKSDCNDGVTI